MFLVDGFGYQTDPDRLGLNGRREYTDRNLIEKWFHTLERGSTTFIIRREAVGRTFVAFIRSAHIIITASDCTNYYFGVRVVTVVVSVDSPQPRALACWGVTVWQKFGTHIVLSQSWVTTEFDVDGSHSGSHWEVTSLDTSSVIPNNTTALIVLVFPSIKTQPRIVLVRYCSVRVCRTRVSRLHRIRSQAPRSALRIRVAELITSPGKSCWNRLPE